MPCRGASLSPSLQYVTPGSDGGMSAARPEPMISADCIASRTRRHNPKVMLAFMSADTWPTGCWVQAMTCMPRERPNEAMRTMRLTRSGNWSRKA